MKYFKFLLVSVTVFVAYSGIAFACLLYYFTSVAKAGKLNYELNISGVHMPLLKDTVFNREKCLITHCPLTLTNNSNDTLKYIVMSASWWDLYSLDNKNFAFAADPWNVFKNSPEVLVLPPHQSTTKIIPIITYKSYYRGQQVRIGFSLQRLGFEFPDLNMSYVLPLAKTTNLIWSNAVTVN